MKRALPLAIGIMMIIVGWQMQDKYEVSGIADQKDVYKALCERGLKTTATLQNEYEKREGRIVKMVTYKFDYVVDGQMYTNEKTTSELPDREFEVTYLAENPETAYRGNVCGTYERIINNQGSPTLMYLGIGLFLVGIVVSLNGLKTLVRGK